nr:FGGY family carbohydrate kinase [Secundilactobacillus similis]
MWLTATRATIKRVVAEAGVPAAEIKGIGISGLYGGSGVPLDDQMQPVRPCLIWLDRRAQAEAEWVKTHVDMAKLATVTGNEVVDPYYGFTKMLWIKQHEPENWQKTRLFLPPSNDVIYRLTGEIAIDHAAAGLIGGVYDVARRDWSDDLLAQLGCHVMCCLSASWIQLKLWVASPMTLPVSWVYRRERQSFPVG